MYPIALRSGMIRSFRDKGLERFFETGDGRRLSVPKRIANILRALDDASRPEDVNLPGFRFHALAGRDKGRYAVDASGNCGSHADGPKAMLPMSILKTITEDGLR